MLLHQKHLFSLPDTVTYLNTAYMAPQLKSVEQIGHRSVSEKNRPFEISNTDFFTQRTRLKKRFATLIEAENYHNVAIIPSVSYGMANVANNLKLNKGDEILVVSEQFPSNVYIWEHAAAQYGAVVKIVAPPKVFNKRGALWNAAILDAITPKTALVAMPHIHWADGTLFHLHAIREKTTRYNALLVIDGTQSVGALPFSVTEIQPDALICAGYKWLLGPYALGVAYYGSYFNDGVPIEHNWLNRLNSEDFTRLTEYQEEFTEKADRYSVGESTNFVLTPMLIAAIEQLLEWQPQRIQHYCGEITSATVRELRQMGCFIEEDSYRAKHLFGIYLPKTIDLALLKQRFADNRIFVSFRGNAIRVASHLYNTEADLKKLMSCFK